MSENPQVLPPGPATRTSVSGIISLIAGILGLLSSWGGVGGLFSIAAVILGHVSKSEIKKNPGTVTGGGLATGGLITGYLGLAIGLCVCVLFVLMWAGLISLPFLSLPFLENLPNYNY
jgi:hypothetical protein